jgi:O-antigen biosynthesis protein
METVVTIVIPDLGGPAARTATLQALARHTPEPYEVMLLLEEMPGQHNLEKQGDQAVRQIAVPAPFNTPAALNRLVATCTTPYILLLESGCIVTPGWLGKLLAPFSDSTVGLTGPSTNSSWNEQKVLRGSEGTGWLVRQIDTFAALIAQRYRNQWHALDTLHGLGDFCYLFKRTLAEQLGGFDEAYGAGPCWEIDFNTRAARAGFRALWVADAYVHRGPTSAWKADSVRNHFATSRQLYQDRFCGLRLEGKKAGYEPHCRGEACEHFAPSNLIQITLRQGLNDSLLEKPPEYKESSGNAPQTTDVELAPAESASNSPSGTSGEERLSKSSSRAANLILSKSDLPLVSCIMPTHNRRAFIQQTLSYFERQDYQNRELIIVDDGEDRIADLLPSDPRIRYIALSMPTSIGAKRNLACEQARGEIIAHWDDDDWYAPHRLQYQVAALLDKKVDITGLETSCFFDLARWQAWTCSPELHRRLFVGDVHGGTLVYWRRVWQRIAHYPAVSLAEDALFLREACRRGARLQKLPHANSFVYIRHNSNAWSLPLGAYIQPNGWKQTDLKAFLPPSELPFYASLSPVAQKDYTSGEQSPDALPHPSQSQERRSGPLRGNQPYPLVSCIMPTYNRRKFVPQALHYFLRQEYPNCELIILDDGTDAIGDLIPADERIRYIRLHEKTTVGAKRNLACEQARGEIIAHWDDDDWHAPQRLLYQIEALLRESADICGVNSLLFYDMEGGHAWQYVYPRSQRTWLSGSTLCYKRTFWASNRFANIDVGEDSRFVSSNRRQRMTTLGDTTFHIGIIHKQNVSPKNTRGSYWRSYPVEEIRLLMEDDWSFYQPCQEKLALVHH